MPNLKEFPLSGTLLALVTRAGTQSTGVGFSDTATSLPAAEGYRFILEVQTVTGTNPTLDVFIDTSADGGTNYYPFLHFAQASTSGQGQQVIMRPYLASGDIATTSAAPLLGTVDGAQGSTAIVQNGPIDPRYIKVRTLVGATTGQTGTFSYAVKYIAQSVGNQMY